MRTAGRKPWKTEKFGHTEKEKGQKMEILRLRLGGGIAGNSNPANSKPVGDGDILRIYVEHSAVNAADIMVALGVDLQTSRNWCNCPFNSSYTYPLPPSSSGSGPHQKDVADYVICQARLKSFLAELTRVQLVSIENANIFLARLQISWTRFLRHQNTKAQVNK